MADFKTLEIAWDQLKDDRENSMKLCKRDLIFGSLYCIVTAVMATLASSLMITLNDFGTAFNITIGVIAGIIIIVDVLYTYNFFYGCILDSKIDEFQITQWFNSMSRLVVNEQAKMIENYQLNIDDLRSENDNLKKSIKNRSK